MRKYIRTVENLEMDGGWLCLDYINTIRHRYEEPWHDYLSGYEQLIIWFRRKKLISKEEGTNLRNYERVHADEARFAHQKCLQTREILYRVFLTVIQKHPPEPLVLNDFNQLVREAYRTLKIVIEPNQSIREEWVKEEDYLLYPLYPVIKSAHELLMSELLSSVKECKSCGWLFLDKSKNKSRRWCNMQTCGSSAKSKRYYKRSKNSE